MEQKEEDNLFMSLPEDIVIDIASRLSTKEASRSKCLSKSWLSLISFNSEFKKLHRQRAEQRPRILLALTNVIRSKPPASNEISKLDCDFQHIYVNSILFEAEPCHDLLCFYNFENIYICSPSTNQYLVLDGSFDHSSHRADVIGVVYIDSLNSYKIIKMSIEHFDKCTRLKFEAFTLQEDGDGYFGIKGDKEEEKKDQINKSSWELISKLTLQHSLDFGNLVGVNAVVYSIVSFRDKPHHKRRVMFLDFKDDHDQKQQYKTFSLPKVCDDINIFQTYTPLSQVKGFLCFPHLSNNDLSTFDLWLLRDHNTSTWFKGYTIVSHIAGRPQQVVYVPPCPPRHPIDQEIDDGDFGQFLYGLRYRGEFYRYDIHSKQGGQLFRGSKLHLVPDNMVFLKNGTRYTRMSLPDFSKSLESPPSTSQPLSPPYFIRVDQGPKATPSPQRKRYPQNTYYPSELIKGSMSHPPPPSPPPPQLLQPCYPSYTPPPPQLPTPQLSKVRTPLLSPHQECLPLPAPPQHYSQTNFYTPVLPQVPPSQHSLPLPLLPPPPPPPCYPQHMYHNMYSPRLSWIIPHPPPSQCCPSNFQHVLHSPEVNMRMPHSALHQHLPPPPQPYYPNNFQQNMFATELKRTLQHPPLPEGKPSRQLPYNHHHSQNDIYSPEIKRRRRHPLPPVCAVPPPPESC